MLEGTAAFSFPGPSMRIVFRILCLPPAPLRNIVADNRSLSAGIMEGIGVTRPARRRASTEKDVLGKVAPILCARHSRGGLHGC